jgi:hypothetical protein
MLVWQTVAGKLGTAMHKNNLSDSDISDKFVRPAVVRAGGHILAQYALRYDQLTQAHLAEALVQETA